MAFNGKEGKPIPLGIAKKWTKNYRDQHPGEVKAHFYGKEQLLNILNDPECMGIRIYYGIDDDGGQKLVLVGASENQNNIYRKSIDGKDTAEDIVLDDSSPCPDSCPEDNNDPLTN